ncbi:MAG: hypothetical protein CM15mP69_6750 [Ectothiorhodospiraceae bacterium]|nr:MAG: hypothetical protein CM15mP69_6750 [Ectothiorhodospiraceae bacterium]
MKNESIQKIFKILRRKNPEPKTDLNYKSKFQLLIAVILSAQATDKSVNAQPKYCSEMQNHQRDFKSWCEKLSSI